MIKINARAILILTVITITIWIGYETYSTLTKATKTIAIRQELLRELTEDKNQEVVKNLDSRISY